MENFLIEYRDPLFGILIFFALVFITAFFSYVWGILKSREEKNSLARFARQFENCADEECLALSQAKAIPLRPLAWLALAYYKSGEYEKSIAIYLGILGRIDDPAFKQEILTALGKTYFKAGFLKRSRDIFLEVLKFFPRNREALEYLLVVYEKLMQYDKAMDVLESLEELECDVRVEKVYVSTLSVINDVRLGEVQKTAALAALYQEHRVLERLFFSYLFARDAVLAWRLLKPENYAELVDILWQLPTDKLDRRSIENHPFLCELYTARGDFLCASASEIFELSVLIGLRRSGFDKATLRFEYLCNSCKNILPVSFHRCPHCLSIGSAKPQIILAKAECETSESLL